MFCDVFVILSVAAEQAEDHALKTKQQNKNHDNGATNERECSTGASVFSSYDVKGKFSHNLHEGGSFRLWGT